MSILALPIMISMTFLTSATYIHTESNSTPTMKLLQKTLTALDGTMAFFRREHKHVNLDAVIGTRIVEASMNIIADRLRVSRLTGKVPPSILDHMTRLRDQSSLISNLTIPNIQQNQPDYFDKIGPIMRPHVFQLNYPSRDVTNPDRVIWPYSSDEMMKEDESDDCLAEIFGTKTGTKCDISQKCWKRMTTFGYNGYSLSHQIFYLEIAQGYDCHLQMMARSVVNSDPSLNQFQEIFCTNMLYEADLISQARYPLKYQDLFMEQAALCGLLGYRGFFSRDWLENILSWQDVQHGCYKWDAWPMGKYMDDTLLSTPHRRYKREEQRVKYGCLCHRTSVAAAALAQYVRYILEAWLVEEGHTMSALRHILQRSSII